jgi:hypothetical protein
MNFLTLCDRWLFPAKNRLQSRFQGIKSQKFYFSRLWDEGRYDELLQALDDSILELEELKEQAQGYTGLKKEIEFKISRLKFRSSEITGLMTRKSQNKPDESLFLVKIEKASEEEDEHLS